MQEYRPIADWLKSTRERQTDEKGDPWTQDRLLDLMRAEIGWAPHRPNYSRYERGRGTPSRETLAKLVEFWKRHGEPGPDLTPREETPVPDLASAILALTGELTAMRLEREAWRRGVVGVLRSYEAGQVPEELLDALAPLLPEDAQPAQRR